MSRLVPTATALALALVHGCGHSESEVPAPTEVSEAPPNVVLVTMDTVRADRIGAYGHDGAGTPAFDGLAARGMRFERAYSPYPLTIPAHSSVFTGQYPPEHGVRDNGDNVLAPEAVTLAEVLGDNGYATGAAVAAFVTSRQWGFAQGFDAYMDDVPRATDFWHASRRGEEVVDDALAWAETVPDDQPTFLWVHMYDAHLPLEPVEPFKSAHEAQPYDAEIAYVDAQVARLIEAFQGEDTLFVVTADHGESNGEHNERDHGLFVYDATQRVPLVIAGPGVSPQVVESPASLVDIMPTILDRVGVEAPDGMSGKALPHEDERPIYMESWQLANRFGFAPHVGVVVGDHKFIDVPRAELYGPSDPGETTNLAPDQSDRVSELDEALEALGFEPPDSSQDALSPEAVEELAALGYMVGVRPDAPVDELPDPKDHTALIRALQTVSLRTADDAVAAEATLRELVANYPEIAELRVRLSQFLMRQKKAEEAEKVISEGLAYSDKSGLRMALTTPLMRQGRVKEAAEVFLSLREEYEFSPRYRTQLLNTLIASGRGKEIPPIAQEFMASYPDDLEIPGVLGVWYARTGNQRDAWPLLERAIQAERPPPDVAFALGMRAIAAGDLEGARKLMEHEVGTWPFNARARRTLARLCRDGKDWEAWATHTDKLTKLKPSDVEAWRDHAQAQFNLKAYDKARVAVDRALELAPKDPDTMLLDANLLAKEGKRDEGAVRFEEAKRLHEARIKEAAARSEEGAP